jgi:hypothetical protein
MLGIAKVDQRIETRHRFENDIAAFAAIATIGAAIFNIFLAAKADRTGAAAARADIDLGLVEKMHG